MANLKISQLTTFTGNVSGSWLVMDDSSLSTTYKVERENFLSGMATTSSLSQYATTSSLNSLSSSIATTDLNQNNVIAGLATTASLSQYATTSSLNALSQSIAVTDLAQSNRLTSIEQKTGSFATTGSNNFIGNQTVTGSIIQTGSLQGNVVALSISSNTASLDLNRGNYFTLQLVSGSATHLNPTNIRPGQTVSVFVNTTGSATMTFASSIKEVDGSQYEPTTGTGLDILTLISKDSSNLYLVNAKNFV